MNLTKNCIFTISECKFSLKFRIVWFYRLFKASMSMLFKGNFSINAPELNVEPTTPKAKTKLSSESTAILDAIK
jgi:hypothetical protein